jgi:MoxR-like ATPase
VTDDKEFKQLVRAEARRSGRRYTSVREELRSTSAPEPFGTQEVRARYDAIVAAIETWVYGAHALARLVAAALLVPGNVLVRALPGNGMTALGQGVAAAIGGHLFSIDGRTGLDPSDIAAWRPDDVVVIAHFDGLERAAQVAVIEASGVPAILLAKVHRIPDRMPFPPDDDTRERFLFRGELAPADPETELRIVDESRSGAHAGGSSKTVVDLDDLGAMRAAAASVEVPPDVRRFVVEVTAAIRADEEVVIGPSTIAALALVRAAAAMAAAAGRQSASVDDVEGVLVPVLGHRILFRDGADGASRDLIGRFGAKSHP